MKTSLAFSAKLIGTALALSLLGTQSLFAYQQENVFWADRRKALRRHASPLLAAVAGNPTASDRKSPADPFIPPTTFRLDSPLSLGRTFPADFLKSRSALMSSLSTEHGTIRKLSLPKNGSLNTVVVHIQDVHGNPEAQWNIREAVRSLMGSGQADLVALEGATKEIDLQPFVDFPDRKAVTMAADYFLKEKMISGPVHAALTARRKLPRILGVDDPALYEANVQAYRDAAPREELARREVLSLQAEVEARKRQAYTPELNSLDQTVLAFRKGKISLGDYVQTLADENASRDFPSIRSFLQALQWERALDFQRVEMERARLVEQLTARLTRDEIQTLLSQTVAHRSGQMGYADFYSQLKGTCRKKGIILSEYPAMDSYVRYVLLAEGISAEALLENMARLEKSAYGRLAKTPEQKILVARSRELWLTEKLVDFSLTPSEWAEYSAHRSIDKDLDLSHFEAFYREAQARDGAMANNLAKAIKSRGKGNRSVAVLVTGGFHAEGVAAELTARGMTVVSYVPKIGKIETPQGSAYLSVFTQEKTPLEKLFQGDKLFLAQPPITGSVRGIAAPALVTMVSLLLASAFSGAGDPQISYALLGGLGLLSIREKGRIFFAAALETKAGVVLLKLVGNPEKIFSFEFSTPSSGNPEPTPPPSNGFKGGGGKINSWKVIVLDPLREQLKWFVLLIGGSTYVLASKYALLVNAGFPLFFVFLVVNGVLLTKLIVPLFLKLEHEDYKIWEREALEPVAKAISYWTLGTFILSYFLLCPWGLNWIAETGQLFSFITAPAAKTLFLSAIVGYVAGVAKHVRHNVRTLPALISGQGGLLPLSRSGSNKMSRPAPGPTKHSIIFKKGENRVSILNGYYSDVLNIFKYGPGNERQARMRALVDEIQQHNPSFYEEQKWSFKDIERLDKLPHYFCALVNAAIFLPLNAHPVGFFEVNGGEASSNGRKKNRGWVNIDPEQWKRSLYLGRDVWEVRSKPNEGIVAMDFGIGILDPEVGKQVANKFISATTGKEDKTQQKIKTLRKRLSDGQGSNKLPGGALVKDIAKLLLEQIREKMVAEDRLFLLYREILCICYGDGQRQVSEDRLELIQAFNKYQQAVVHQFLKNDAFTRLAWEKAQTPSEIAMSIDQSENPNPASVIGFEPPPTLIARVITRSKSKLGNRLDSVAGIIQPRLIGLIAALQYLKEGNKCELALIFFLQEMDSLFTSLQPNSAPLKKAFMDIMEDIGVRSKSDLIDRIWKENVNESVDMAISMANDLLENNFFTYQERHKHLFGKDPLPGQPEMSEVPLPSNNEDKAPPKTFQGTVTEPATPTSANTPTVHGTRSQVSFSEEPPLDPVGDLIRTVQEKRDFGQPMLALEELYKFQNGKTDIDARLIELGKSLVPDVLSEAQTLCDHKIEEPLPDVWDDVSINIFTSGLINAMGSLSGILKENPWREAILPDEARDVINQHIQRLREWLFMGLNDYNQSVIPLVLLRNADVFGLSEGERLFLFNYETLNSWDKTPSLIDIQSALDISEDEVLELQHTLADLVKSPAPFLLDLETVEPKVEEEGASEFNVDSSGGIVVDGYPIFVDINCPKISPAQDVFFSLVAAINKATTEAKSVGRILKSRGGMHVVSTTQKKHGDYVLFAKMMGDRVVILWFGTNQDCHPIGLRAKTTFNGTILKRAQILEDPTESSKLERLKSDNKIPGHKSNGSGSGTVQFAVFGTPETIMPMTFFIPVALTAVFLNWPSWVAVLAAVIIVAVSLGKKSVRLFKTSKSVRETPFSPKPPSDAPRELAEILATADQGNREEAVRRLIQLMNGTTPIRVESILGPSPLEKLETYTGSELFKEVRFQAGFSQAMGTLFPEGLPMVRARKIVERFGPFARNAVSFKGLAQDADLKIRGTLLAVVTKEMMPDLGKKVASLKNAAGNNQVYWVAENAMVLNSLKKLLPNGILLFRPDLIDRDGGALVVSGRALERVVQTKRSLQHFAVALPRDAQVDMEGVGETSELRNAVFFFLDELLAGMKLHFNTLKTIDVVARRIASAA